jgi:hypothetical protein
MSLYRQSGGPAPRRLVAAVVAALVLGLLAGFAIARATAGDPSAQDVVTRLRSELRPVANGLAILPTEYPQAARGSGNETAAVRGGLDRIRTALRRASPDLRVLDADGTAALVQAVDRVEAAVGAKAPPAEVERLAVAATAALERVPGGR